MIAAIIRHYYDSITGKLRKRLLLYISVQPEYLCYCAIEGIIKCESHKLLKF